MREERGRGRDGEGKKGEDPANAAVETFFRQRISLYDTPACSLFFPFSFSRFFFYEPDLSVLRRRPRDSGDSARKIAYVRFAANIRGHAGMSGMMAHGRARRERPPPPPPSPHHRRCRYRHRRRRRQRRRRTLAVAAALDRVALRSGARGAVV